jgi:hypothetical protein
MIRDKSYSPLVVDLTGPDGNAFVLMGLAQRLGRKLGMEKDEIEALLTKMRMGDYENLINTFDEAFGDFVVLER